jgi:polyisoprenoid-binding protein YceI
MKNLKTLALALLVSFSASMNAQTKKIDASKSTINWVGKKVTGEHSGTVNLKEGSLVFKKKKLVGGTFTVDMTTMTATDLTGEYQGKLNGHLKSDDFFGTDKFETSTLVFKKIAVKAGGIYTITGDLTIKGVKESITFDLVTTTNSATTSLKIDRTKYGIKYGSGSFFDNLGDKAIANEFELKVALVF